MSVEVRVPALGESIVDATIASWLKKEGDSVRRGDALAELETDKVNVEVNAEQDGVLQKIVKQTGDVVAVGEVIGVIGEATGAAASGSANGTTQAPASVESTVETTSPMPVQSAASANGGSASTTDAQRPPSPLARRIAAEYKVDISQIKGSSPHGRVTKDDVIQYLEQNVQKPVDSTTPVATSMPGAAPVLSQAPGAMAPISQVASVRADREERIRMSRRRQTIAQRLVAA